MSGSGRGVCQFQAGDVVEYRSSKKGLRGSWFRSKVSQKKHLFMHIGLDNSVPKSFRHLGNEFKIDQKSNLW